MNRRRCRNLLAFPFLALAFQGCARVHNRQVVYPERRTAPVQVDTTDGVRVRAPFVDVHVPRRQAGPPRDLDVPMLDR